MTIYRVLPGKTIIHGGIEYQAGECLSLTPNYALVHAANIEIHEAPEESLESGEESPRATRRRRSAAAPEVTEESDA